MTAGRVKSSQKMSISRRNLLGGKRLDETLRGCRGGAVKFGHLRGGGAGQAQGFALGGHLAGQADGERLGGIDASSGKKQIADHGIANVALQSRDAAEAGDKSQAQLRESRSAPSCRR